MHQLRQTKAFIHQALHAHQAVTNRPELEKLSYRLHRWWRECCIDHSNTADIQRQLLQILIEACVTTVDYLTQLVAHRILADCFSHAYLSRYLQKHTTSKTTTVSGVTTTDEVTPANEIVAAFAQAYHPTLAYTEGFVPLRTHSPLAVEKTPTDGPLPKAAEPMETKSRLIESLEVTPDPLAFLDERSLLRMGETNKSMHALALIQLFSRKTQDAQKLQRQRVKLWLVSPNTWPAIAESLNLSTKQQVELLQQLKKNCLFAIQKQKSDFKLKRASLLYSALFAKINPKKKSKLRYKAEFFINQLSKPKESSYSHMNPISFELAPYLCDLAPCLTTAEKQQILTCIKKKPLSSCDTEADTTTVSILTATTIAFYEEAIEDNLITAITRPIETTNEHILYTIEQAIHTLLLKLNQKQIDSLFSTHLQPHLSNLMPGAGLRIVYAIAARLSQQQVDQLAAAVIEIIASNESQTVDSQIHVNALRCCQAIAARVSNPNTVLTALTQYVMQAKPVTPHSLDYPIWLNYLKRADYTTWFTAIEQLIPPDQAEPLSTYTMLATDSAKLIPARMIIEFTQSLVNPESKADWKNSFHKLDTLKAITPATMPNPFFNAYVRHAYHQLEGILDIRKLIDYLEKLFKFLAENINRFSLEQRKELFEYILADIVKPAQLQADYHYKLLQAYIPYANHAEIDRIYQSICWLAENRNSFGLRLVATQFLAHVSRFSDSFIDKLIATSQPDTSPLWQLVINQLSQEKIAKLLTQSINTISKLKNEKPTPEASRDRKQTFGLIIAAMRAELSEPNRKPVFCTILARMGAKLSREQFTQAETVLEELGDEAIEMRCLLYINAGKVSDASIKFILTTIKQQRFKHLIEHLHQIIPHLTPAYLAMLTQARAEKPLNRSGNYQAFLFTAHHFHPEQQIARPAEPQLGGGGGGGGKG